VLSVPRCYRQDSESVIELVGLLVNWGSVVVICCYENLVDEAGDSSGIQGKKPLPSNGYGRLKRLYAVVRVIFLSVFLSETVVVICSYVL
jgi:hypothetical protein